MSASTSHAALLLLLLVAAALCGTSYGSNTCTDGSLSRYAALATQFTTCIENTGNDQLSMCKGCGDTFSLFAEASRNCSKPVDSDLEGMFDECGELQQLCTTGYNTSVTKTNDCLALGGATCACQSWAMQARVAAHRCNRDLPEPVKRVTQMCYACDSDEVNSTRAELEVCMQGAGNDTSGEKHCDCIDAFLDVTEALERCHMTVGANQRTAFSLCALTSSSDGCDATTVSEMVLDAELCILSAASPCTCRGQVDDIFGHIADCASAHGNASRAVMPNDVDFPPFAEICDGDFVPIATPLYDMVCAKCELFAGSSGCKTAVATYCGAAAATDAAKPARWCDKCPGESCAGSLMHACSECRWTDVDDKAQLLVDCVQDGDGCGCQPLADDLRESLEACGLQLSNQATKLFANCDMQSNCDTTELNATYMQFTSCTAATSLCDCQDDMLEYLAAAHACNVPVAANILSSAKSLCDTDLKCTEVNYQRHLSSVQECLKEEALCDCVEDFNELQVILTECNMTHATATASTANGTAAGFAPANELAQKFQLCPGSKARCQPLKVLEASGDTFTCIKEKGACGCEDYLEDFEEAAADCNTTVPRDVRLQFAACNDDVVTIPEVCGTCTEAFSTGDNVKKAQCAAQAEAYCATNAGSNLCSKCASGTLTADCISHLTSTCSSCDFTVVASAKAAFTTCRSSGPLCDCIIEFESYREELKACGSAAPSDLLEVMDKCGSTLITCDFDAVTSTQAAVGKCIEAKPVCDCIDVYEAFEGELEGCNLALPAALDHDFDMCAQSACGGDIKAAASEVEQCIAEAKTNSEASSAFDKPVCDCLDDMDVLSFTLAKCADAVDDTVNALVDSFKAVFVPCGTPSDTCDAAAKKRTNSTSMALRHCLDTKPLCKCDSEFESLVDALAECGRVPETKFLDLFEACSDEVCDRIALAGAVDDLLQCTDTQAACSCGDAFDYASSMAKSCDEVLDDTSPIYRLGKLLATQCDGANTDDDDDAGDSGSDGDKSLLERLSLVCDACTGSTSLTKSCLSAGTMLCANKEELTGDAAAVCSECLPHPSATCLTGIAKACSTCDVTDAESAFTDLEDCIQSKPACDCITEFDAAKQVVGACGLSLPSAIVEAISRCSTTALPDGCVVSDIGDAVDELKDCTKERSLCACQEEWDEYKGAAAACNRDVDSDLASEFDQCDGSVCADAISKTLVHVDSCIHTAERVCDCEPVYEELTDLLDSCDVEESNDKISDAFDNCDKLEANPSIIEFASSVVLTEAAKGQAVLTLVRFGGSGAKAAQAADVVVSLFTDEGFTGVTRKVTWAQGDVADKTLAIPLSLASLQRVATFYADITDVDGARLGYEASVTITVEAAPVQKGLKIAYPGSGVVWGTNVTRPVIFKAVGYDASATFSLSLINDASGAAVPIASGVAASAMVTFLVPEDTAVGSYVVVVVNDADSTQQAVSEPFNVETNTATAGFKFGATPALMYTGAEVNIAFTAHSSSSDAIVLLFLLRRTTATDAAATTATASDGTVYAAEAFLARFAVSSGTSSISFRPTTDLEVSPSRVAGDYRIGAVLLFGDDYLEALSAKMSLVLPVALDVGAWGACSEACGEGERERTVACIDAREASFGNPVNMAKCDVFDLEAEEEEECFAKACQAYDWKVGKWSKCSKPCGLGKQARTVVCVDATGNDVTDAQCDAQPGVDDKPRTERTCPDYKPCETFTWEASDWRACSEKCDGGKQRRSVVCRGSQGTLGDDDNCDEASEPEDEQECNTQACPSFVWHATPWSLCSKKCGGGSQTRTVTCRDTASKATVDDSNCDADDKDDASRLCNVQTCPEDIAYWKPGQWSPCNATCGKGYATREVLCIDGAGNQLGDSACEAGSEDGDVEVPRSIVRCEADTKCDPCEDLDCNNGQCTNGACVCEEGFKLPFCNTPTSCSGELDADGECCESGVLSSEGDCCEASSAGGATPVRDVKGRCCASGVLDACGVCDGNGKTVSLHGKCCRGGDDVTLDAGGRCCTKARLDACDVCDGSGLSCKLTFKLEVKLPPNVTAADLEDGGSLKRLEFMQETYPGIVSRILGVREGRVNANSLTVVTTARRLHDSARHLAASSVQVSSDITPPVAGDTTVDPDTMATTLTSTTDADVVGVSDVGTAGQCLNDVCEIGEACTGDNADSCCPEDCVVTTQTCPIPAGSAEECGGSTKGTCDSGTGSCSCASGYTGTDCSVCDNGFYVTGDGHCVFVPAQASSTAGSGSSSDGSSGTTTEPTGDTPWLLYGSIGLGALVVVGGVAACIVIGVRRRGGSSSSSSGKRGATELGDGVGERKPAKRATSGKFVELGDDVEGRTGKLEFGNPMIEMQMQPGGAQRKSFPAASAPRV
eukprot:CAMPEP_0197634238 /NCGR_PEP_ID=MMETSP1338-20131121/10378_1 /TAXON_ID=43686 ORGANISM="Pelagodinium beii, Strain RCC1491" /NCGR_SAMPLE_ID=MMETSP1338 /ASSEMBLY_ACC=CAM_ASM_000754 /LENGTH=2376 /DNA_ID=CAMNT_0043206061 /DNA_START=128 /DNA_END=7258 /DNA_ORIENTATION=+